jgi:hypothetical protein
MSDRFALKIEKAWLAEAGSGLEKRDGHWILRDGLRMPVSMKTRAALLPLHPAALGVQAVQPLAENCRA